MKAHRQLLLALALLFSVSSACRAHVNMQELKDTLEAVASDYDARIGIAVITSRADTLEVNNSPDYPLMSVFKLHQAIALCDKFARSGTPLDTVVKVDAATLNPHTWSPMLHDHKEPIIVLPVSELLRYALMQSDNNASNYMFENLCSVAETDSCIATLIPRECFGLSATEAQMWSNHDLAHENYSSPLGAASLIHSLFAEAVLNPGYAAFIRCALLECRTGTDRIAAPLAAHSGISIAHKTGSGFTTEQGILGAHNDVAFITLPDGSHYALAVLIKDFHGTPGLASETIARVSALVHNAVTHP